MKKILGFALTVALFATACDKTPENNDDNGYRYQTLTFEGDYWDDKVDSPQYMGPLLYGTGYSWHDAETDLYSELNFNYDSYMYWNGGIAVSNYFSRDLEANNSYDQQLVVYADGANSGKNCIVCNGFVSSWSDSRPSLEFRNGTGCITKMYVCKTAYSCNVATFGNDFTAKLGKNDWLKIVATGYTRGLGGEETEGKSAELYLFRNGSFTFDGWQEWGLSELGEIWKVKFDMQWSGGADTFSIPAYFAIDDITVCKKQL